MRGLSTDVDRIILMMYNFPKVGCIRGWLDLGPIGYIIIFILVIAGFLISIIWTLISSTMAGLLYLGVFAVAFVLYCTGRRLWKAFVPTLILTPVPFFCIQLRHLDENGGNFMASIFAMFIILVMSIVAYLAFGRGKHSVEKLGDESEEEPVNYGVGDFEGHGWSIEKKK